MVACEFCGAVVGATAPGTFQWTSGWVENRAAGGGHGITLPERADRYACKVCIGMLRDGIHPGQGQLL